MVGPNARRCRIVDTGVRKQLDLQIHVPVESMVEPDDGVRRNQIELDPLAGGRGDAPLDLARDLPRAAQADRGAPLDDPVRQQPARRRAARAPAQRPRGEGDRPRPPRQPRARGAARRRGDAEGRRAPVPRRDLEPRARHRHGRRRPRDPGRVAEVGRARPAADRPRRALASATSAADGSSRSSAPTCSSARSSPSGCATARSRRRSSRATRSTCSPSRSSRSPPRRPRTSRSRSTTCTRSSPAPTATPSSAASSSRTCSTCSTAATRPPSSPSCGRGSSGTGSRARSRRAPGARQLAVTNAGTIPDRGLYSVTLPDGRRVGELDEEMVYEARPGQTFLLGAIDLADRGDRPRPGDRHAGARPPGRGPVLEGRQRRTPARAR